MKDINEVRAYSLKELSDIYEISLKSLRSQLTPYKELIGKRYGRYYTIVQIEIIFAKLGLPHNTE